MLAAGLDRSLERAFRYERHDQTQRWNAAETSHNLILSASMTADFAADHSAWTAAARAGAMDALTARPWSTEDATSTLGTLRRCGDVISVGLVARSLWEAGPLDALADAARSISAESWTHTSSTANLTLLEQAGDVLAVDDADRHAAWATDVLANPSTFIRRVRPNFAVAHYVARALAGLLPACSASFHDEVAIVLGGMSSERLAAGAQDYVHVLVALRPHDLSDSAAERLVDLAGEQDAPILTAHALGAGSRSSRAQALLEARAADGDREALTLLDPAALPDRVIETVANQNTILLATISEEAENGSFAHRHPDPAETLVRLGLWHPSRIDWLALARYLAHPLVRGAFKWNACQLLADGADRLPADVRAMLAETVGDLAESPLDVLARDGGGLGAAQLTLSIALGAEDPAKVPTRILALLGGSARTRADTAVMIGRTPHAAHLLPVLVGLGHDADPIVRVGAAIGLAKHVVRAADAADPILVQALDDQLGLDGAQIAAAAAAVLGRAASSSTVVAPLVARLLNHRSARVRARTSGGNR